MVDETKVAADRKATLDYHEFPKPGKLEIRATKPMTTGHDLSRAYSPEVAEACLEIKNDPGDARRYTAKDNLVAVITKLHGGSGVGEYRCAGVKASDGG